MEWSRGIRQENEMACKTGCLNSTEGCGTTGRGTTFGLPSSVVEDKEVAPVPKLIRQVHSVVVSQWL
jgi:hypothetical protein